VKQLKVEFHYYMAKNLDFSQQSTQEKEDFSSKMRISCETAKKVRRISIGIQIGH
jgi:hypothetical protein